MRLGGDAYECIVCGVRFAVPSADKTEIVIAADADRPEARMIMLNGVEIHRCGHGAGTAGGEQRLVVNGSGASPDSASEFTRAQRVGDWIHRGQLLPRGHR